MAPAPRRRAKSEARAPATTSSAALSAWASGAMARHGGSLSTCARAANGAAALAFPVIPLVFGSGFADAALPLTLLLPGTVALTCWSLVSLYVISTLRRPGTTTLIQAGALVVSLPFYYLAVREWEMVGAAVVSSGVYLAVFALGLVVLCRSAAVRVGQLVPKPDDLRRVAAFARASIRGAHG